MQKQTTGCQISPCLLSPCQQNRLNSSLTPKNDLTKIIAFKQATICMLTALLAVDSSTNRRKSYMLTTFIFITNKKASQKKNHRQHFLLLMCHMQWLQELFGQLNQQNSMKLIHNDINRYLIRTKAQLAYPSHVFWYDCIHKLYRGHLGQPPGSKNKAKTCSSSKSLAPDMSQSEFTAWILSL